MATGETVSSGVQWQDFDPKEQEGWQDYEPKKPEAVKPLPTGLGNHTNQYQALPAERTPEGRAAAVAKREQEEPTLGQVALGAAKSAGGLVQKPVNWALSKISGVAPPPAPPIQGLPQNVGAGLEQGFEMALTGGPLRNLATRALRYVPALGRTAAPLARIGAEAVNTGLSAGLHGQPVGPAAAMGAGGAGLGEVAAAVAPKVAESALGVTNRMRGHGRTIGEAALGETTGVRPATIGKQAGSKLAELTAELEQKAASATPVRPPSVKPALDVVDAAIDKAKAKNSGPVISKLREVRDQLTKAVETGEPLPVETNAVDLLNRKRGVGDLVSSWSALEKKGVQKTLPSVYRALDKEFDLAVPGGEKLNQRISSLIPVQQRAKQIENLAPLSQRIAHRMAAHTGALAGAGIGGTLGYREHGLPGALVGGTAGLVLPELAVSPTAQMTVARYGPGVVSKTGRLGTMMLPRSVENEETEKKKKKED
jgi:hypothetical protein